MRTDWDRLDDILEAIELIDKYAKRGRAAFDSDELIQVWIVKHLENIGEAARATSKEFREQHSEIPWEDMIAQRSYLAHEYFAIDKDEVWDTVEIDISALKSQVERILKERT